jgi:hypothetical protein
MRARAVIGGGYVCVKANAIKAASSRMYGRTNRPISCYEREKKIVCVDSEKQVSLC